MGVTYDTGALIAAVNGHRGIWALHAGFLAEEIVPIIPALVLAKVWRHDDGHVNLSRFLAMCEIEEMSAEQAKAVGRLAGRSNHDDISDITVIEGAIRRRDAVATSNPAALRAIADSVGARLHIEPI